MNDSNFSVLMRVKEIENKLDGQGSILRILARLDDLENFKMMQNETNNNYQKKFIKLDSDVIALQNA